MKTKKTKKADKPAKLSDALIAGMIANMRSIAAAKMEALADYELALRSAPDDVDTCLKKLHLFDRAACRAVKAEHAYYRAYVRQREDFTRVIAKSVSEKR